MLIDAVSHPITSFPKTSSLLFVSGSNNYTIFEDQNSDGLTVTVIKGTDGSLKSIQENLRATSVANFAEKHYFCSSFNSNLYCFDEKQEISLIGNLRCPEKINCLAVFPPGDDFLCGSLESGTVFLNALNNPGEGKSIFTIDDSNIKFLKVFLDPSPQDSDSVHFLAASEKHIQLAKFHPSCKTVSLSWHFSVLGEIRDIFFLDPDILLVLVENSASSGYCELVKKGVSQYKVSVKSPLAMIKITDLHFMISTNEKELYTLEISSGFVTGLEKVSNSFHVLLQSTANSKKQIRIFGFSKVNGNIQEIGLRDFDAIDVEIITHKKKKMQLLSLLGSAGSNVQAKLVHEDQNRSTERVSLLVKSNISKIKAIVFMSTPFFHTQSVIFSAANFTVSFDLMHAENDGANFGRVKEQSLKGLIGANSTGKLNLTIKVILEDGCMKDLMLEVPFLTGFRKVLPTTAAGGGGGSTASSNSLVKCSFVSLPTDLSDSVYVNWLKTILLLPPGVTPDATSATTLACQQDSITFSISNKEISVASNRLDLLAAISKSLAIFFKTENLNCNISTFSSEFLTRLQAIFVTIDNVSTTKSKIESDIQLKHEEIKVYAVRLEDFRQIHKFDKLKKLANIVLPRALRELQVLHLQLDSTKEMLNEEIKFLNSAVKGYANLRQGSFQKAMTDKAREAIKKKDSRELVLAIKS
jgi:Ciliary BBSome complex subunit 2, C-terminal